MRAVASLMPQELEVKRSLEELSDDELAAAIGILRQFLARRRERKRTKRSMRQVACSSGRIFANRLTVFGYLATRLSSLAGD